MADPAPEDSARLRLAARAASRRLPARQEAPRLSFVVPAYDEERLIGRTLEALHAAARAAGVSYEIVVADDASTDTTKAVARAAGARLVSVAHRQIAATRNAGAREARGRFLVFVDADTVVPEETLRAALAALEGGVAGGGAPFAFDGQVPWGFRGLGWFGVLVCRAARFAPGCFLFCTRAAFDAAGGFDARLYAGEELALSRALRRCGRFVILRERVLTSGRKLRTYSLPEIVRGFLSLVPRRARPELWYGTRRHDPETAPVSDGRQPEVKRIEWRAQHDSNVRPSGPQPDALSN